MTAKKEGTGFWVSHFFPAMVVCTFEEKHPEVTDNLEAGSTSGLKK